MHKSIKALQVFIFKCFFFCYVWNRKNLIALSDLVRWPLRSACRIVTDNRSQVQKAWSWYFVNYLMNFMGVPQKSTLSIVWWGPTCRLLYWTSITTGTWLRLPAHKLHLMVNIYLRLRVDLSPWLLLLAKGRVPGWSGHVYQETALCSPLFISCITTGLMLIYWLSLSSAVSSLYLLLVILDYEVNYHNNILNTRDKCDMLQGRCICWLLHLLHQWLHTEDIIR